MSLFGPGNSTLSYSPRFCFQLVLNRAWLLIVVFCLFLNAMSILWVSGLYGSVIFLWNNYNRTMFYQRKKGKQIFQFSRQCSTRVYHHEAVNKNATFSLAKKLFIPNGFLKTKGKILLCYTSINV